MKIFIDAGHNYAKWNTGATGNGLKEQDVTFEIAKRLGNKFKEVGVDILLSRNNITDILGTNNNTSLQTRVDKANNWSADLFISIHCNSYILSSATGTETLVYSTKSSSYNLAKNIANNIATKLSLKNRGVKLRPDLQILKKTKMPALLVETAFISNINDAQKLKDRKDDFVEAIFNSVCDYYNIKKVVNTPKKEETKPTASTVPSPYTYHIEGTTHIIEVDPRNLFGVETQCSTKKVKYNNFVNSIFFAPQKNGKAYPCGIMVNAGQVIANTCTHNKPVATLIIYGANDVQLKYVTDITKEKGVWFAVSGYGIYPEITAKQEGFVGIYTDVLRNANRPIIGYRKKDNKIVIAVRAGTTAERAKQTAKNLGLDFAISLDGGGSTTLKVDGKYKFKGDGRKIFGGLIWS